MGAYITATGIAFGLLAIWGGSGARLWPVSLILREM